MAEEVPTLLQALRPVTVGKQPVVADPYKAIRQDVEEKSPNEFVRGKPQESLLAIAAIVLVGQYDRVPLHADQTRVRDRDSVGVASQVLQHQFRPGERRLGVDHPFLAVELAQQSLECLGIGQVLDGPHQFQVAIVVGGLQPRQILATIETGQDPDGYEKVFATGDPPIPRR